MQLTSSAFSHGGQIPSRFTCDGDDLSPPLVIDEVPAGTHSLVLIMDDPDVPKDLRADGVWDHWAAWNIPPDTREILEGREPEGVGGKNSWGRTGYGGPCPPDREHRYFFKLYALDALLSLPAGSTKTEVEKVMKGHVLAEAVLLGRYKRAA